MILVETTAFTRRITSLMTDGDYRAVQMALLSDPKAGDVIPGSGGLRKLRWTAPGRGKRGGVRIIYYHIDSKARIYLLVAYAKSERDDLSPSEIRSLRRLLEDP